MSVLEQEPVVRVDSAEEQYAYLTASFGAPSAWSVESQTWSSLPDGEQIEIATIRLQTGDTASVRFGAVFDDDRFDGSSGSETEPSTSWLDRVMAASVEFSEANPPHHPGTIARFPVPAAGYANALSVPMGLIAVDGSTRALFAPPRIVALSRGSLQPIGVGEFPGFDPEFWPPEQLSNWPLPSLHGVSPDQLQGIIQRFSACWSRVVEAWFTRDDGTHQFLEEDVRAAEEYRTMLDAPTMASYSERMNPVFAAWVRDLIARPF